MKVLKVLAIIVGGFVGMIVFSAILLAFIGGGVDAPTSAEKDVVESNDTRSDYQRKLDSLNYEQVAYSVLDDYARNLVKSNGHVNYKRIFGSRFSNYAIVGFSFKADNIYGQTREYVITCSVSYAYLAEKYTDEQLEMYGLPKPKLEITNIQVVER